MRIESRITQAGLDNHKNFSRLTGRDSSGKIIFRQRLEHKDRQALREDLRQLPPGTPVVLCSGRNDKVTLEEMRAARVAAFVLKPFNLVELADTVECLLRDGRANKVN